MNDLIRRQDAIDALNTLSCCGYVEEAFERLAEKVMSVPSAQPEQVAIENVHFDEEKLKEIVRDLVERIDFVSNWIPCSEQTPKIYEHVITCDKDGVVDDNFMTKLGWSKGYHIVAWMPLPEPYEEVEE